MCKSVYDLPQRGVKSLICVCKEPYTRIHQYKSFHQKSVCYAQKCVCKEPHMCMQRVLDLCAQSPIRVCEEPYI